MALLENLGLFLKAPDPRPADEVDDDIAAELRAHLELRALDSVAEGMPAGEARRDAEERFGDVQAIQSACRRIKLGERIVLQRINLVLMVVLLGSVVVLALKTLSTQRESFAAMSEIEGQLAALNRTLAESTGREPAGPFAESDLAPGVRSTPVPSGAPAVVPAERELEREVTPEDWLARFRAAEGWRAGLALGYEIAALPAHEALALMRAIYHQIPDVAHRQQILKPFVFHGGHVHAIEILHLAATDPELAVQGWAFGYLKQYAYRDFTDDYEAYRAWWDRYGGRPLSVVLTENAASFVERVRLAQGAELEKLLRDFGRLDLRPGEVAGVELATVLEEAGLLDVIQTWMLRADAGRKKVALGWLAELKPSEAWLRVNLLPVLENPTLYSTEVVSAAAGALAEFEAAWAVEPLIELLAATTPESSLGYTNVSRALAELRDPRAIPVMIAVIVADDRKETRYDVGYFGLEKLTGVAWDESHDAAWWIGWWEKNQHRLPEPIQGAEIPVLR